MNYRSLYSLLIISLTIFSANAADLKDREAQQAGGKASLTDVKLEVAANGTSSMPDNKQQYAVYSSADQLPEGYQLKLPLRKDSPLPNLKFDLEEGDEEAKAARATWAQLPEHQVMIHGVEDWVMLRILNYYFGKDRSSGFIYSDPKDQKKLLKSLNMTAKDFAKNYIAAALQLKQVFAGSIVSLDYENPHKVCDETFTPCGLVFDVPARCIIKAKSLDMNSKVELADGNPEQFHQDTQAWMNEAEKKWGGLEPRSKILADSYRPITQTMAAPIVNEVCFVPQVGNSCIRLIGIFINERTGRAGADADIYDRHLSYVPFFREMAADLRLKLYTVKAKNKENVADQGCCSCLCCWKTPQYVEQRYTFPIARVDTKGCVTQEGISVYNPALQEGSSSNGSQEDGQS